MFPNINKVIELIDLNAISSSRKAELQVLIDYVQEKIDQKMSVQLNFICTHNSRRSQLSQIWAKVAAYHFQIPLKSFSGGVEITECNPRTISSLERLGFDVVFEAQQNPVYKVSFSPKEKPADLSSKLFDDPVNPKNNFAAVMTCSHADENCPFVPGCEKRISLRYDDPKAFDDSPLESAMYDYRSFQIASEMFFVFNAIQKK